MIAPLLAIALVGAGPPAVRLGLRRLGCPVHARWLAVIHGAAILTAVGLLVDRGALAVWLSGPWMLVAAGLALIALRSVARIARVRGLRSSLDRLGTSVAFGFLAVGSVWLGADRAGLALLGFDPTIVLLTAVHFHVAGFILAIVGIETASRSSSRLVGAGSAAILLGSPMTALGFLGLPFLGWIGAEVVAGGGLAIGVGLVRVARQVPGLPGVGLAVAGLALFITMPLAAVYAVGTTFAIPVLDIPAMAAIHGGLNVVAVAVPATLALTLTDR